MYECNLLRLQSHLQRADQAEKWEKRSNQLRQKYGTIDLEEYKKVEAELAELRKTSVQKSELQKV